MASDHTNPTLVVHAPNVHTGGGLRLLNEFLCVPSISVRLAQLDERTKNTLRLRHPVIQFFVRRSIFSRLLAEWRLRRNVTACDRVLCFHGLPPLFRLSASVVVFIQNRVLLEDGALIGYPLSTKIRLSIERAWLRAMRNHASRYIVQTPSMARCLKKFMGGKPEIACLAFAASSLISPHTVGGCTRKTIDFLYVASGEAHKNHRRLLEAWRLLGNAGLKPSLALTVDPSSYPALAEEVLRVARECSLNIANLGQLSAEAVAKAYQSSSAMIYPSQTESFGLPLIEATFHGLPIIASELDYVRDVVVPAETFDPVSPVSIARAVKRFLGRAEPTISLQSAEGFLAEALR